MGDVGQAGRTVLFVSHNMAAVNALCSSAIILDAGSIVDGGPAQAIVSKYLGAQSLVERERDWSDPREAPGGGGITLSSVRVATPDRGADLTIDSGASVEVRFLNSLPRINLDCTMYVRNAEGILLFESGCIVSSDDDSEVGSYRLAPKSRPTSSTPGAYFVTLVFGKDQGMCCSGSRTSSPSTSRTRRPGAVATWGRRRG